MAKAKIGEEFQLRVGDNVGAGANVFRQLRDAGVEVIATCCYRIDGSAHLSFIASETQKAHDLLRELELESTTNSVLLVELSDEPGSFAALLEKIAALGVHAQSAYLTPAKSGPGLAVLKTDENAKVLAGLEDDAEPKT